MLRFHIGFPSLNLWPWRVNPLRHERNPSSLAGLPRPGPGQWDGRWTILYISICTYLDINIYIYNLSKYQSVYIYIYNINKSINKSTYQSTTQPINQPMNLSSTKRTCWNAALASVTIPQDLLKTGPVNPPYGFV